MCHAEFALKSMPPVILPGAISVLQETGHRRFGSGIPSQSPGHRQSITLTRGYVQPPKPGEKCRGIRRRGGVSYSRRREAPVLLLKDARGQRFAQVKIEGRASGHDATTRVADLSVDAVAAVADSVEHELGTGILGADR